MEFKSYYGDSNKTVIGRLPTLRESLTMGHDYAITIEGVYARVCPEKDEFLIGFINVSAESPDCRIPYNKMVEIAAKKDPSLVEFFMAASNVKSVSKEEKEGYKKFEYHDILWYIETT